jgi:chromate transporter
MASFAVPSSWIDRPPRSCKRSLPASIMTRFAARPCCSAAPGGFAAWRGFTIPSALALIAFAYGVGSLGDISHVARSHGLKIVAVAVVAQAVWRMAQSLCPDRERATLAIAATLLTLAIPSAIGQIGAVVTGGLIGWRFLPGMNNAKAAPLAIPVGRKTAIASLTLFAALFLELPLLAPATSDHTIELISSFYRSGSRVFGGGGMLCCLCCNKPSCRAAGSATMRSSPVMPRRRRFPARSSLSLPIWERR